MELTITVEDYLSSDEIKEVAIHTLRHAFRESSRAQVASLVSKAITADLVFEDSDKVMLSQKVKDAIDDISTWRVFSDGTKGNEVIAEVVSENAHVIKGKVLAAIEKCAPNIEDALQSFVMERIRAAFAKE